MQIKHKKTILGVLGCMILFLGLSYTNCGTTEMTEEENFSEPETFTSQNHLKSILPAGLYKATLENGEKLELRSDGDRVWVAGWIGKSLSEGLHTVTLEDGRQLQLESDGKDRVWVAGWSSGRR